LSFDGKLPQHAKVFQQGELELIVATSSKGYQQAKRLNCTGKLHVLELGNDKVDLRQFVKTLYQDFGVKTLLCEGGPRVYGAFLAAQLIDEEFLTLSPTVIGNAESPRPGLVEGVAFMPERYPRSKPISLRRAGDHLFLRSRYSYP
jgi:riboflavin biosynthesis pyrimidine reductase